MTISAVSNGIDAGSASTGSKSSNLSIDSGTFLTLLAAQLCNQDPLNPQTDTEFVTQLAQMSSLEEMRSLAAGMSSLQAYSFAGKYVYAQVINSVTGETGYCCGAVESIVKSGGSYYAVIGDTTVSVDNILQVFDTSAVETGSQLAGVSVLIGKTVTGSFRDETGTEQTVTDEVTGISYSNGSVYLTVGGERILLESITDISQT